MSRPTTVKIDIKFKLFISNRLREALGVFCQLMVAKVKRNNYAHYVSNSKDINVHFYIS